MGRQAIARRRVAPLAAAGVASKGTAAAAAAPAQAGYFYQGNYTSATALTLPNGTVEWFTLEPASGCFSGSGALVYTVNYSPDISLGGCVSEFDVGQNYTGAPRSLDGEAVITSTTSGRQARTTQSRGAGGTSLGATHSHPAQWSTSAR